MEAKEPVMLCQTFNINQGVFLIQAESISNCTLIFRFILTGVSSWGIGCGEEGVPGVYTSIKSNLCFIDWATKCKHGRKYNNFYNYREDCKNWFDELIDNMRRRKQGELAKKALAFKNESCISFDIPKRTQ